MVVIQKAGSGKWFGADQAFEYLTPHGYGLKSDNTITLDPEGRPHVIHDCGWISVRIKDS